MELKTKVVAEEGKQDLFITRAFELPVELVFKAYTEPELVEQWMGTKVLKLENKAHGSYQFVTTDYKGAAFPSLVLLVFIIPSWYFRPANRRISFRDKKVKADEPASSLVLQ